jgi:hypothetical protein
MVDEEYRAALQRGARVIADKRDADVLVYKGDIERPHDARLIDLTAGRERRKNVLFFITTRGGDLNAAFRIARCLRRSAGTLVVLGADELVMFDHAELGPLDVQLWKDDELGERSSGLTPTQAFISLDAQVREAFFSMVLDLKQRLLLTTRTTGRSTRSSIRFASARCTANRRSRLSTGGA